jgi:hypothetical protein
MEAGGRPDAHLLAPHTGPSPHLVLGGPQLLLQRCLVPLLRRQLRPQLGQLRLGLKMEGKGGQARRRSFSRKASAAPLRTL